MLHEDRLTLALPALQIRPASLFLEVWEFLALAWLLFIGQEPVGASSQGHGQR